MRIGRDIVMGLLAGAVGFVANYLVTYADRDGFSERTGYPSEMLTVQAVGCGLFFALAGFIAALSLDAFWPSRRSRPCDLPGQDAPQTRQGPQTRRESPECPDGGQGPGGDASEPGCEGS
jgi:hypothetical protein